jgi:hypothetical protein
MVLGLLLAASLVTVLVIVMSCELQARADEELMVLPADDRQRFDAIVAPLLADPDFGRVDL